MQDYSGNILAPTWQSWGLFKINTTCVLQISQSTIAHVQLHMYNCMAWHVDNLKIGHKEEQVVRNVIEQLEKEYGKLTDTAGDTYTYCNMNFIKDSKVIVDMKDYLKEAIAEFKIDYRKSINSPAAIYLFEVNNNQSKLDNKRKK